MNKNSLKVALFQMQSIDNTQANFEQFMKLFESLQHPQQLDLISLPENCFFYRLHENFDPITMDSDCLKSLQKLAVKYDLAIHIGGTPLKEEKHVFNASLWIDSQTMETTYKKLHLFDCNFKGYEVCESDTFSKGKKPAIKEYKGWKFGLSICYDLRFFELFYYYRSQGVHAFLNPSAFLYITGLMHWHTLIKARAIEFQSYMLAANQAGTHKGQIGGERRSFGHSLIVDPWGEVIAEASSDKVQVLEQDIKKDHVEKVRDRFPVEPNRQIPLKVF